MSEEELLKHFKEARDELILHHEELKADIESLITSIKNPHSTDDVKLTAIDTAISILSDTLAGVRFNVLSSLPVNPIGDIEETIALYCKMKTKELKNLKAQYK